MTQKARELLAIMAEKYDMVKDSSLGFTDYMSFPDTVIDELVSEGCVVKQNDIVGTIELTKFGYAEARK